MYTDKAEIIRLLSENATTGEKVYETVSTETKARIESEDLRKKDSTGNLIVYKRLFMLPPNITINEGDKIRAIEIGKKTIIEDYMKAEVVFPVARFTLHHYEVHCK